MKHRPVFAAVFARMAEGAERAGLHDMRAGLLAEARGRTLEVGAGTGLNLPHYPDAVSELVLTEPDRFMAKRLRKQVDAYRSPIATQVIESPAEALPFEDHRFDTVLATLVLCTVDDPERALAEIERVLAPGGRLLYLEHVRSHDRRVARWQDRVERPWGWIGGCHPNRATGELLRASQLELERRETSEMPKAPPIARPLILGAAKRAARDVRSQNV